MGKRGISHSRDGSWNGRLLSLRPGAKVFPHDPSVALRDKRLIRKALLQAIEEGDFEAVIEIYRAHLRVMNRTRTAKALKVSRTYVYKMMKPTANPSLRTFTAFMKVLAD